MEIIKANEVSKTFGTHKALQDASIAVPEGTIYGLLGPNGAGKTTMIRIINQIIAPDSGEILFKGKKLQADDVALIGYLPEERGLYKKMKVGEQAIYLAQLKGMSRNDTLKKLKYWFEKFEIQSWWDKKVEELSKGMAQKIQFIITILHDPELLIFDEPFSGFDPINANLLKNEILDLKAKGKTIIFSTHNMGSVEELCDSISLINKSKVILSGNVHEIRSQYKSGLFEIQYPLSNRNVELLLRENYKIISQHSNQHIVTAIIKDNSNSTDNELLKLLLPQLHIISYREILPGMNEVFISVVKNSNISVE